MLSKLSTISEIIVGSIEEQEVRLQEAVSASEQVNIVAGKLRDISIKIDNDFEQFKVQDS